MRHFSINFAYSGNRYQALVQKQTCHPVQFTVYDVYPTISKLPQRMVFFSSPDSDQLVYESFDIKQSAIVKVIGEAIFTTCSVKRIAVHQ